MIACVHDPINGGGGRRPKHPPTKCSQSVACYLRPRTVYTVMLNLRPLHISPMEAKWYEDVHDLVRGWGG